MRFNAVNVSRTRYEGTKQAETILRAARAVFIQEGVEGFSLRRVAKEANLSLSSVQHVFPTMDSLLVAMLEYVITGYDVRYAELVGSLPPSPGLRLEAVIDFLLADAFDQDSRRFFFGFWALSTHNTLAGELLKEAYSHHATSLAAYIAAVRPDLSDEECLGRAIQIAALMEGSAVFSATGNKVMPRQSLLQSFKDGVMAVVRATAKGEAGRSAPAAPTRALQGKADRRDKRSRRTRVS